VNLKREGNFIFLGIRPERNVPISGRLSCAEFFAVKKKKRKE